MGSKSSVERTEQSLARRRARLQTARAAAAAASAGVVRLDGQLAANIEQVDHCETELAAAEARIVVLKKTIKKAQKQRTKLRAGRAKARKDLGRSRDEAVAAERKYDKAMLADLLRREKHLDLSQHGGSGDGAVLPAPTNDGTPVNAKPAAANPAVPAVAARSAAPVVSAPAAETPVEAPLASAPKAATVPAAPPAPTAAVEAPVANGARPAAGRTARPRQARATTASTSRRSTGTRAARATTAPAVK